MAELTWSPEAERWLRDIHNYIAQDNPAAATRTVEALYQKAEILREFPESGYRYWQRPDRHIRILLHGHYRIAYVIKCTNQHLISQTVKAKVEAAWRNSIPQAARPTCRTPYPKPKSATTASDGIRLQ